MSNHGHRGIYINLVISQKFLSTYQNSSTAARKYTGCILVDLGIYLSSVESDQLDRGIYLGVLKTSDHMQIKVKMLNPSQELPAPTQAPNQDLKDMDVLCTFKIKLESQNSEYGCTKDQ